MVVIYDGGAHSNLVLKVASWLEHSGRFKVDLLSIVKKEEEEGSGAAAKTDLLAQLGIEAKETQLAQGTAESAALVYSAIDSYNPDLVVVGASVGKFSILESPPFLHMIMQLQCPVIVAREFGIPGVRRATSFFKRVAGR